MKKAKFPVEAIALGIILFSKNMKESMVVGILVIFSALFADVVRGFLKSKIPEWSESISVLLLTASVCASTMQLAYAVLGWESTGKLWVIHLVLGLLCARQVLWKSAEEEELILIQSAAAWMFWIGFGMIREFLSFGTIFEISVGQVFFQSRQFQHVMFGFLAAGMGIAFTNSMFGTRQQKKKVKREEAFYVMIPAVFFTQPFVFSFSKTWIGNGLAAIVTLFLFCSIQNKLIFSRPGDAYRGLPVELLSMGFLYMILNMF